MTVRSTRIRARSAVVRIRRVGNVGMAAAGSQEMHLWGVRSD